MLKNIFKPMIVEADDMQATLQLSKMTIENSEGTKEIAPDVCIIPKDGKALFLTIEQSRKLRLQMEELEKAALKYITPF